MRVYNYGARAQSVGPELRNQMRLGHEYYNRLVEAENERRTRAWGDKRPPHEDCGCKRCKQHWRDLSARVRAAPRLDKIPLRAEATKAGLDWGTYLMVERAFDAACRSTRASRTLRFRPRRKGVLAAVQIQRGCDPERRYLLERAPDPRTGRRARDGRGRHTIRLRIGSTGPGNRTPVWSEPVQLELHRVPEGTAKWVLVTLRRQADREIAAVQIVCDDIPPRTDLAPRGVVAVDVSWRQVEAGLRIAYARSDRGEVHELVLSRHWLAQAAQADEIRGVRADNLKALKARDPRFSRARSSAGVHRVIATLRAEGTLRVGKHLRAWLERDRHLWQYEIGCYVSSTQRRRDALRKWARELRRSYAIVIIKDTAHKRIKEQAATGPERLPRPARRQGHHAAPGETIEILRRVFGPDRVAVVDAAHTTNRCRCGHVNDHGPETIVECERCGDRRDRDEVSTRNILDAWVRGESRSATARKTVAKFAKKHNKRR